MILKTTLLIAVFFFCSPSVFTQTSNPLTPAAQKQTSPTPPSELPYGTPGIPISVLENTLIRVITDQPLSTKRSKDGMPVTFSVNEDVVVNNVLAIPRGATIHGEVVRNKKAGIVAGSPELTLKLDTLDLGGQSYPLYTYQLQVKGASKTRPSAEQVEGGAVMGALTGAVIADSTNGSFTHATAAADIGGGAAIGAGVVETTAIATPRPVIKIPAESQLDFYLASPISIQPITAKEAERLGQRLPSSPPVLYIRGDTP